jgi:hypothetical protein
VDKGLPPQRKRPAIKNSEDSTNLVNQSSKERLNRAVERIE